MDEIYQLVKTRIQKVLDLYNNLLEDNFSVSNNPKYQDDLRKSREEEKFRTEKENWILNVLKQLKEYSQDQKQVIYERSNDIMKLINPGFKEIRLLISENKSNFI